MVWLKQWHYSWWQIEIFIFTILSNGNDPISKGGLNHWPPQLLTFTSYSTPTHPEPSRLVAIYRSFYTMSVTMSVIWHKKQCCFFWSPNFSYFHRWQHGKTYSGSFDREDCSAPGYSGDELSPESLPKTLTIHKDDYPRWSLLRGIPNWLCLPHDRRNQHVGILRKIPVRV